MIKPVNKDVLKRTLSDLKGNPRPVEFRVTARLVDGPRGEVKSGNVTLSFDTLDAFGGSGSAPRPGEYALFALAGCISQLFAWHAALNDVHLESFTITITAKHDLLPMLDPAAGWPGMKDVEVEVQVNTPEKEKLEGLLRTIRDGAPVLATFVKPVPVRLRTVINGQPARDETIMV